MEQPFYIGQKVVCISIFSKTEEIKWPAKDKTYTIRTIEFDELCSGWFIRLEEIKNPPKHYIQGLLEARFCSTKFAPIQEGFEAITFERVLEEEKVSVN